MSEHAIQALCDLHPFWGDTMHTTRHPPAFPAFHSTPMDPVQEQLPLLGYTASELFNLQASLWEAPKKTLA
jgi:hypothetical protein